MKLSDEKRLWMLFLNSFFSIRNVPDEDNPIDPDTKPIDPDDPPI